MLPLGSAKLQLVVREPYVGDGRSYRILREVVDQSTIVRAHSKMHQARVFLDGPYRALTVRLGDEVRFEPSSQPLRVLGLKRKRRA